VPHIVLLPGDGIGPEVTAAATRVLEAVAARPGRSLTLASHPIGGAALKAGLPALPPETLEACRRSDAVLLGAVGDPAFDHLPSSERPEGGLLALRRGLGAYANLRPARLWAGFEDLGPLKAEVARGADLLIVRELTGGLYFGEPRGIDRDAGVAFNTMRYSVGEIERIARVAFDAARRRRRHVTSVDKANVLETSQLWRAVVTRVAADYPDVTLQHMYVDACAMVLITAPSRFDVILTENLFGDILSDEAAVLAGSLGMLPSASLGDRRTEHGRFGLYEPIHGSAPDIAGQDRANPLGTILSAAMLLRWSLGLAAAADDVETAVREAIDAGFRTADLVPPNGDRDGVEVVGTRAMASAVLERIGSGVGAAT